MHGLLLMIFENRHTYTYRMVKTLVVKNLNKFGECLSILQSFICQPFDFLCIDA